MKTTTTKAIATLKNTIQEAEQAWTAFDKEFSHSGPATAEYNLAQKELRRALPPVRDALSAVLAEHLELLTVRLSEVRNNITASVADAHAKLPESVRDFLCGPSASLFENGIRCNPKILPMVQLEERTAEAWRGTTSRLATLKKGVGLDGSPGRVTAKASAWLRRLLHERETLLGTVDR